MKASTELIKLIQLENDSSSIHTRNKAIFYLRKWEDDGEKRKDDLKKLICKCEEAIKIGNWKKVKLFLIRCW